MSLIFFNDDYNKEKLLKLVMANFARNHALKHYDPSKEIHRMKINEEFSNLFFYAEKGEVKRLREELADKVGLGLSEVTFSEKGRSMEEIVKMLGKKMCELSGGSQLRLTNLKFVAKKLIKKYFEEFKNIVNDRRERFKKTLEFMDMDLLEIEAARMRLHSFLT